MLSQERFLIKVFQGYQKDCFSFYLLILVILWHLLLPKLEIDKKSQRKNIRWVFAVYWLGIKENLIVAFLSKAGIAQYCILKISYQ